MNILHLKYALAVAQTGSINKASELLMTGQPNPSRAIKELEGSVGISLFSRSARGMSVTPEGERFLARARKILEDLDSLETMYAQAPEEKRRFSISVPRVSYIADAFVRFTNKTREQSLDLFYMETNSGQSIQNVCSGDYDLAIVRYSSEQEEFYRELFAEKDLDWELLGEYGRVALMNQKNPLAKREHLCLRDLAPYVEIFHADQPLPQGGQGLPGMEAEPSAGPSIHVFDRASRYDLLSRNTLVYVWAAPIPEEIQERYGIVQKQCEDSRFTYKDVLLFRKGYRLSALDSLFLEELKQAGMGGRG